MTKELLQLDHVTLRDEGHGFLQDICLFLREGDCICLSGPENSGRQMLLSFIRNRGNPYKGVALFEGVPLYHQKLSLREKRKIAYLERPVPLLNSLTLSENFFLLRESNQKKFWLDEKNMRIQTQTVLESYGLAYDLDQPLNTLSESDRMLLGIVRSADQGAKVILLNEPSNGMDSEEMEQFCLLIRQLKKRHVGILISDEHPGRFSSVLTEIDEMDHGQIIRKHWLNNAESFEVKLPDAFAEEMAGDISSETQSSEVRNPIFTYQDDIIHFDVHKGEILFITGTDTFTRRKLWERLKGEQQSVSVHMKSEGKFITQPSVDAARDHKIFYWQFGDQSSELFRNLSVWENVLLPSMRKISNFGFYQKNADFLRNQKDFFTEDLDSMQMSELTLSDRYKIIMERWKFYRPNVLFLYNILSTANNADRAYLSRELRNLAERGTAIVLFEVNNKEAKSLADRSVPFEAYPKQKESETIKKRNGWKTQFLNNPSGNAVKLIICAVYVFMTISGRLTFNGTFLCRQYCLQGLSALALYLEILLGNLDLSIIAQVSLSTVIFGLTLQSTASVLSAGIAALLIHLLAGALKGWLIARLRISPLILTMAIQMIFLNIWPGTKPIMLSEYIRTGSAVAAIVGIVLFSLSFIFVRILLNNTYPGFLIKMTGENALLTSNSGINTMRVYIGTHMFASLLLYFAMIITILTTPIGSSSVSQQHLYQTIAVCVISGVRIGNPGNRFFSLLTGILSIVLLNQILMSTHYYNTLYPIVLGAAVLAGLYSNNYFQKKNI